MGRPLSVVFIGYEGSGKTTHISLACDKLRRFGVKPYCTYVKTVFLAARFVSSLRLSRNLHRVAVALDLALNSVLLPFLWFAKTFIIPLILKRRVVLVEEGLFGSLVDYVHAAFVLNLRPVVRRSLGLLFFLFRMGYGDGVVFTWYDLSLLPHRWRERGTPPELPTYMFVQVLIFNIITKILRCNLFQINTALDLEFNNRQVLNYITSLLA
jgi:hypothetical protein